MLEAGMLDAQKHSEDAETKPGREKEGAAEFRPWGNVPVVTPLGLGQREKRETGLLRGRGAAPRNSIPPKIQLFVCL